MTGTGKSRRGTIPLVRNIVEAQESFAVVDPKGEIFQQTACYTEKEYKTHVIDFRNILFTECVNPLSSAMEYFSSGNPIDKQHSMEIVDDLAYALYPNPQKGDPFWTESARMLFVGVVYSLMSIGNPGLVTLPSAFQFIAGGEERVGLYKKAIDVFVNCLDRDSVASIQLQSYINTANDTAAGIRSTYLQGLSLFSRSEGLISMFSFDDLHINYLDGEQATAIYIIIPDETAIFDSIAGVIVNQIIKHYIRLAQEKYSGRLPRRINFILEECGNISNAIPSLPHIMSAGRSRNIRTFLVLQSLSQLEQTYGKSNACTIRSNADLLVAYRINHLETLKELSQLCGEREVIKENMVFREPLITPSQIGAMKTGQALIMISGRTKFISCLPDYTELFDLSGWRAPKIYKQKKRGKPVIFNIKEFLLEGDDSSKYGEKASGFRRELLANELKIINNSISIASNSDVGVRKVTLKKKPDSNKMDLDVITRQLDREIRELTGEDEKSIVLIKCGDDKGKIISIIKNYTNLEEDEISEKVNNLPCSFYFGSAEDSELAKDEICNAGGMVIFGEVTDL